MKRLGLPPLLLPATLFLAANLQAEDAKPPVKPAGPPAPMMGSRRADELLQRFDTNRDGKLDEDETAAAHEAMLQEQMNRQAAVAAAPGGQQFRQQMLEKFDKNHDGRLDDDERAEMQKNLQNQGLGPGGPIREELIKRFDKNADGKIDLDEAAAMQKFVQERRAPGGGPGGPRERVIRQFDKNSDGKLDDAEWIAAREQVLQMLAEAGPRMGPAGNLETPAETQARLERVAAEVARRRAQRDKAKAQGDETKEAK